ncbi:MAG: thioredoxin-disulfide reductase [Verrucomicrobiae bacterium]|nr:thioredoxin-disulfide reductase [Verrucomicrobiae bacterium]
MSANVRKVTILGTGCAGLTAAIYTARANLKPLVLTGKMPGGLLTTTSIVENYPGFPEGIDGFQLMTLMQKQAERFGAEVQFGEIEKVDFSQHPFRLWKESEEILSHSLIIATGASHRHLGLESEKLLDKKGVTYCATCDGALPMFRNQPLVVVGGGDSALEEALYLTHFASKVYLVHRRDELRASQIMQERALAHEKIQPVWNSIVTEILDVTQDRVTGVKLQNTLDKSISQLECAGVFIAIGLIPNTSLFVDQLDRNEEGYIKLKTGTRTSIPGIFAAGDVADSVYRQAITAAGTGCAAAIETERYLSTLI